MRSRPYSSLPFSAPLLFLILGLAAAGAQTPAGFSQRRINETAGILERARRDILETPHLRQKGEGWPDYIRRVTAPLPGEKADAYRKRLESYLQILKQAGEASAAARQMPALHAADDANRKLWSLINQNLSGLPAHLSTLQTLVQQAAAPKAPGVDPKASAALGTELVRTLQMLIDAQNALRDARP